MERRLQPQRAVDKFHLQFAFSQTNPIIHPHILIIFNE